MACGQAVPAQGAAPPPTARPIPAAPPATAPIPVPDTTRQLPAFPQSALRAQRAPGRPVWPLITCIAALFVAGAALSVVWTVRSLTAASRPSEAKGSPFTVVQPARGAAGPLTAAPAPGQTGGAPLTAAPAPGQGSPSLVATPRPKILAQDLAELPPPIAVGPRPPVNPLPPMLAGRPPQGNGEPMTPAAPQGGEPPPQAAAPGQAPAAPEAPPQPQMPPEVLAYLRWLSEDIDMWRAAMEQEAVAALPQYLPYLMTGGLGMNPENLQENPAAPLAREYFAWHRLLMQLRTRFQRLDHLDAFWRAERAPGRPHVPEACWRLHQLFGAALEVQAGASLAVAQGMAAKRLDQVTQQMAASGRAQQLLEEADRNTGAVCARYGVQPWFHIQVIPGTTPPPSLLPR